MSEASVSIVIPAYNAEHLLGRALESIRAQEPSPTEVVVVDDGSTDGTPDLARGFDGVRLVQQSNKGLPGARNAGASAATGGLLFFLDADDELMPGGLAAVLE